MRARLLMIVLGGLLALAGCSSVGGGGNAAEPAANEADATFSLQMIPHHRQTIEVSKLATEKSQDPFVTDVANTLESN